MHTKKIIAYLALGIGLSLGVYLLFRPHSAVQTPYTGNPVLYTRYDCPHCKNVEKYITDNKIEEKIKLEQKEIHQTANADDFTKKAKACGLLETEMGVPMLYDGTRCYLGDQDIINYLIEKTK